jgi:23S rRNA (uracil1939-C5)-methyltransferase
MRKKRKNRDRKAAPTGPKDGEQFTITHLGRHGDGVAALESGPVYIPFALPGETVTIQRAGNDIAKPSADRIEPFCPHFTRCGGCMTQHLSQDKYIEWKRGTIETALRNREIVAPVADLVDAHGAGRRRTTLHIRSKSGTLVAGFMRAGSHDLIEIDACPILAPPLTNAPELARALGGAIPDLSGSLDIQITATNSGLDCDIRGIDKLSLDARMNLGELAELHDLARVSVAGEAVAERRRPILRFGAADITLPPGGFLQATVAGEEILAGLVLEKVGTAQRAADLFSGIGTFALRLAERTAVMAVDGWGPAVEALTQAARHTPGLKPVTVEKRDLSGHPLLSNELNGFDAVVFDPPRAGAKEQAYELATSGVKTIVAVSCNPATFARDAEILINGGYELIDVTPVDQFKWTAHVELVGHFQRE